MAHLKNKSEFNIDAATLLISSNCYAPSVHCSYYAVYQLMKHYFVRYKRITYEDLSNLMRSDRRRTSHKYLIEEYFQYVKRDSGYKIDRISLRNLERKVNDLKHFREESDYDNMLITIEYADKALEYSNEIIRKVKRIK